MPEQIRQLGPKELEGLRLFLTGVVPYIPSAGDSVASQLGVLPSEAETKQGIFSRGGGSSVIFDPPRLRTVYDISSLNIVTPVLEFFVEPPTETRMSISGSFGCLAALYVNGVLSLSELIPTESFSVSNAEFKVKTNYSFKSPPRQSQVSLPQSISLSKNDAIAINLVSYFTLSRVTESEEMAAIGISAYGGATSSLFYSQTLGKR